MGPKSRDAAAGREPIADQPRARRETTGGDHEEMFSRRKRALSRRGVAKQGALAACARDVYEHRP